MSFRYTPVIVVVMVMLVTAGLLLVVSRHHVPTPAKGSSQPPTATVAAPPSQPGMKIQGAKITQRDPHGKVVWEVKANGEFKFSEDRQTASGHDVQFELMSQGRSPLVVKAPVFAADYKAGRLTFSQGASGVIANGSGSFTVNRLVYQFNTGKLVGSGGAKFVRGRYCATASTLVLDPKARRLRLGGGVRFTGSG